MQGNRILYAIVAVASVLLSLAPARGQELYRWQPGPYAFKQVDETWHDGARDRDVPVRLYVPRARAGDEKGGAKASGEKAAEGGRFPVIVFSHGLGASRTSYAYFGQHMASWGYLVVAPTHAGSDTEALMEWIKKHGGVKPGEDGAKGAAVRDGWLKSSVEDPANLTNRPKDIAFVIDRLAVEATTKDIADLTRIGMAGHSFGAHTSMQIGGMTIDLPDAKGKSFREARVKAVLPMSPEGPGAMGIGAGSWEHFAAPVLFLTGTKDYGQGARSADWRRAGFEHVSGVDDYLVTLNGAGHMTFGGLGSANGPVGRDMPLDVAPEEPKAADPVAKREQMRDRARDVLRQRKAEKERGESDWNHHVKMIDSLSTSFFDAYLRDDAKAREWLAAYTLAKHADCTAEFKPGVGAEKK